MEGSLHQEKKEINGTKRIKKRVLKHGDIKEIKINKNCPKFILGQCFFAHVKTIYKEAPTEAQEHILKSFNLMNEWVSKGLKDKLTVRHLKDLFGETTDKE